MNLSYIHGVSDLASEGWTAADLTRPDRRPCQDLAAAPVGRRYAGLLPPLAAVLGLDCASSKDEGISANDTDRLDL